MRRFFTFCCLFFLLLAPPAVRAADESTTIGTILEVEGSATVTREGQKPVPAAVDMDIGEKDVVTTGESSRVFIQLIDDTEFSLAEKASFTASEYEFDADDASDNKARYSVMQGAFRYVSGLVAKKENPDVSIDTPFGSIGIRGTEIWGGDTDEGYGIHVDDGAIDVKNEGGAVRVKKGQGTFLGGRNKKPREAAAWSEKRIERARGTVRFKNRERLLKKKAEYKPRQMKLREKHKEKVKLRRDKRKSLRDGIEKKKMERREELREKKGKIKDRKTGLLDKKQRREAGKESGKAAREAALQRKAQKKEKRGGFLQGLKEKVGKTNLRGGKASKRDAKNGDEDEEEESDNKKRDKRARRNRK